MRVLCLLSLLCAVFLAVFTLPMAVATDKAGCKPAGGPVGHALQSITFQVEDLPQGKLYTVVIPPGSGYEIRPAVSEGLETIESFARNNPKAIAVINAGYFDANNKKTTSYVTLDGKVVADPKENERLVGNDNLKPYLSRIFDRSRFVTKTCEKVWSQEQYVTRYMYGIKPFWGTDQMRPLPDSCPLQSLGAGPALLRSDKDPLELALLYNKDTGAFLQSKNDPVAASAYLEGFIDYDKDGRLTRDPIGVFKPTSRSAVGIKEDGSVILMMAAQVPEENKTGFSLPQLAEQMKRHGAVEALNLDGGGSSGIVYRGLAHYGKYVKGQPEKRPVKSVLMVVPAGKTD